MSSIGQKIRAVREHLGYSQGVIADKLGVDRTAVVKWERGTNRMDRSNLEQFSKVTGASMDWLCDDTAVTSMMPLVVRTQGQEAPAPKPTSYGNVMRDFWNNIVPERLQEKRQDLWAGKIYNPQVDVILKPLRPDILSEHAAIELLAAPRAYYYQVAAKVTQLYAFGRIYDQNLRLHMVAYQPDPETLEGEAADIAHAMIEVHGTAARLADKLGIVYHVVRNEEEALKLLTTIA